jgi:hypothetical protein
MNDWIVIQTNSSPATAPLGVVVINQADATRRFSTQPFANDPVPPGYPMSWAPMSVSVDPYHNVIYTADSSPGMIAALSLKDNDLSKVWTVSQRTTEFLALIGPRSRRVLIGTEIPPGQAPDQNTTDFVVWRDAQTGGELARTRQLPAMTSGAMIQPYYFKKIFYLGLEGDVLELTTQPAPE